MMFQKKTTKRPAKQVVGGTITSSSHHTALTSQNVNRHSSSTPRDDKSDPPMEWEPVIRQPLFQSMMMNLGFSNIEGSGLATGTPLQRSIPVGQPLKPPPGSVPVDMTAYPAPQGGRDLSFGVMLKMARECPLYPRCLHHKM